MRIGRRRAASIVLGIVAAGMVAGTAAAATSHPAVRTAKPKPAPAAEGQKPVAHGHTPHFRPARGAAAADAKRLGALVGKECTGRADMQRDEHQWVVLCSNGRTFVVELPAPHQAAAPPVECSLAGTGPEQACFP
jgi:hypothetical protein